MKWIIIISAILFIFGLAGLFLNKNKYFYTPSSKNLYYKANPQKAPNYEKAKYYKTVPNYYKANPSRAPNYVNPEYNPPKNYIKAPDKKKKTKGQATMEAVKSGFK